MFTTKINDLEELKQRIRDKVAAIEKKRRKNFQKKLIFIKKKMISIVRMLYSKQNK